MKESEEIVDAKDLHKALITHFSYLVDIVGYDYALEAIMKEAEKLSARESEEWVCSGNLQINALSNKFRLYRSPQ